MMQQVATKGSDIAALPISIDASKAADTVEQDATAFADAFAKVNPENSASNTAAKNADDVTDVHWRKSESSQKVQSESASGVESTEDIPEKSTVDNKAVEEDSEGEVISERAADMVRDSAKSENKDEAALKDEDLLPEHEQQYVVSELGHQGNQTVETDWLAFVDSIRQLKGETEHHSESPINASDQGELPEKPELLPTEELIADEVQLLVNELGESVVESSALEPDPELSDEFSTLIALLKGTPTTDENVLTQSTAKNDDIQALADKIIDAVTAMMDAEAGSDEVAQPTSTDNIEVTQMAAALLAMLGHHSTPKNNREGSGVDTGISDGIDAEASGDAGLLLSIIQAELSGDAQGQSSNDGEPKGEAGTHAKTLSNLFAATEQGDADASTDIANLINPLLTEGKEQTQEIVSGAIVERVTSALPAGVSDTQKAEVKQGIAEAVSQYQKGLMDSSTVTATLESAISDVIVSAEAMGRDQADLLVSTELKQIGMVSAMATSLSQSVPSAATTLQSITAGTVNGVNEVQQLVAEQQDKQIQDNNKPVNIHQPEGQQQLAEKIRWMVNARNSMAEIRLDPPELGSMQVRVNVSGDSASVSFVVQSPQARDALAQAEPRLRDMLAEQGISLGESFVSQQQQQSTGEGQTGTGSGGQGEFAGEPDEETQISEQPLTRQAQGGIDDYA